MQRLRGSDAFAIYSDTPTSPFVTFKIAIYEPTDPDDPPGLAELKAFVLQAVEVLGRRRTGMRVVRVPLDLHHPVWVADPEFSPLHHIHEARLPAPGTETELCDFVSRLAGIPLDPDRPLWEIWLLDGLQGGRLAAVLKIHHSLADGKMVAAMIEKTHTGKLATRLPKAPDAEPLPGKWRLVSDALVDLARSYTVELPHYYHHLVQAREGSAALEAPQGGMPNLSAPWTILNSTGGSARLYRFITIPLAEFKALSRQFDCTINTLVLGVCSEALKRYLAAVDEVPATSLITAMPVGDQAGSNPATLLRSDIHNNNLAVAILPLFQNIEDFEERVRAIAQASRDAIATVRRSNGRRFDNYLDYLPGTFIRLINNYMTKRSIEHKPPHANIVISNVPGPRETLYALDGRLRLANLTSTGNLTDAGSANITVWSYAGKLNFSFFLRRDALPEPLELVHGVERVWHELRERYLDSAGDADVTGASAR